MAVNNTVLASALQRRAKGYLDSISSHVPLLEWLRSKGRYISTDGGTTLEFELERLLDRPATTFGEFVRRSVMDEEA